MKTEQPKFKSKPFCTRDESKGGENSVFVYINDSESYLEPIHPNLTIYRSIKTKEIVGCKIYGIEWPLSGLEMAHLSANPSEMSGATLAELPEVTQRRMRGHTT